MPRRGLILDLDNTLYSWVDAFLPSFRAMTHTLTKQLRADEEDIVADFKEVYRRHGTVEYPQAVEELPLWDRLSVSMDERARLVVLARKVFSITYRRNLKLFPNVEQTLEWARREHIVVVGLSDALERWVIYRLRVLGIAKHFQGLYTWHEGPWFEDRLPFRSSIRKRFHLRASELKPNGRIVQSVVDEFGLDPKSTFMVGDSLLKDVAAAQAAGVQDVWARYGTQSREVNLDTLRIISPWSKTAGPISAAGASLTATHVIDDFGELVGIIGPSEPTLFDVLGKTD